MLFELLPYPMHIVITFLKPSKFYITSKNQRPVRSTSGKVGGARLRPFMVIALSKCKKKLCAGQRVMFTRAVLRLVWPFDGIVQQHID